MSFEVDTDSLRKFSGFLEDFGRDAWSLELSMNSLDMTDHGEGLLFGLSGYHADVVESMTRRVSLLSMIGDEAGTEIEFAADSYDKEDQEDAARLDKGYQGDSGDGTFMFKDPPSKTSFDYKEASEGLDVAKEDVDGLEPKAGWLENGLRFVSDRGSYMYYARELLSGICSSVGLFEETNGDPVSFLVQTLSGDWRAWAECALQWRGCSWVIHKMAGQFDSALAKLQEDWQGNAADAALEYFSKLKEAMDVEAETFKHLYESYKLCAELAYEVQTYVSDFVNTILDLAIDFIVICMTGGMAAPAALVRDLVGAVLTLGIVIIQTVKMAETIIQAMSMDDAPKCELRKLPGAGKSRLYDHPAEAV
ncbi:WXG100 family type VII secretion target [Amycolatopsis sp. EV170708-02-1]|uniref:WXG100 family type VII secretion target n=1 Tax=Amycolatopsis sp. EV170708-02-1 TaxID=2919322 RepID=UPI001F0CA758|nr:hypothetical protein [Amycolatopsis sp. EV170708-02-1]UMP04760.1 hypothetical protein MJQ72_07960 [Amycolatopsis sp. EV170708-02-1]